MKERAVQYDEEAPTSPGSHYEHAFLASHIPSFLTSKELQETDGSFSAPLRFTRRRAQTTIWSRREKDPRRPRVRGGNFGTRKLSKLHTITWYDEGDS